MKKDYVDSKRKELLENLLKKENDLLRDIAVESIMLTTKFTTKKSKRKRKSAIKLLELPSYGHDILRAIRKLDKLGDKLCKVQDKMSKYENR
jgi:hypothetical protein